METGFDLHCVANLECVVQPNYFDLILISPAASSNKRRLRFYNWDFAIRYGFRDHMLLAALNEVGMMVARAANPTKATNRGKSAVRDMLTKILER